MPILRVRLEKTVALTMNRQSVGASRLVYAIVLGKKYHYQHGSSAVAYIGTTKKGVRRIAASAAARAEEMFRYQGVQSFDVRMITCDPRAGVPTWTKLERALLLVFREIYGEIPIGNVQGARMRETNEFDYFSRERLRKVLGALEDPN